MGLGLNWEAITTWIIVAIPLRYVVQSFHLPRTIQTGIESQLPNYEDTKNRVPNHHTCRVAKTTVRKR
jgi:hypothetical protein